MAIPVRDPAATDMTITLSIRPETLGSPSGVVFQAVIEELGYVICANGEVDWVY